MRTYMSTMVVPLFLDGTKRQRLPMPFGKTTCGAARDENATGTSYMPYPDDW